MGLLSWLTRKAQGASLENPTTPITAETVFGYYGDSGEMVSPETAMRVAAVWACVRLLAGSISTLPLDVFRPTESGGRQKENAHPYADLIRYQPNSEISRVTWLDGAVHDLNLSAGNHYALLRRNGFGRVVEIIPLDPSLVEVERRNGQVFYALRSADYQIREYRRPEDIIHIPGPGYSPISLKGMTPIGALRNPVGSALAADRHAASFWRNGGHHPGILSYDGQSRPSPEVMEKVSNKFRGEWGGAKNAGTPMFLGDAFKYTEIGVKNSDAQYIEQRKFSVTEIARIFQVPPHMIGDLDKATFSNIEEQGINYVQYSLMPWLIRIESELNRKLFPDHSHFVKFNIDGLQRGNFSSRMDGYVKATQSFMTLNEVRSLENLPPVEGGDVVRVPMNTTPSNIDVGTSQQ